MNQKCRKRLLISEKAFDYLIQCLKQGNTLSKKVLKSIDLKQGKIFTFLPPYVTEEQAIEFAFGGKLKESNKKINLDNGLSMSEIPNCETNLAGELEHHLKKSSQNICIIENSMAISTDPCLKNFLSHLFFFKNQVYHYLTPSDARGDRIKRTIGESSSIPIFIGYMTSLTGNISEIAGFDREEIPGGLLEGLVRGVEKLFVGAYDGESYIFWEKIEHDE